MIVRVWQGETTAENATLYSTHLREHVVPALERLPGYEGVALLRRDVDRGVEFVVVTMWQSMEAVRGFAGDDSDIAVIDPAARAVLSRGDEFVRHYELAFAAPARAADSTNARNG